MHASDRAALVGLNLLAEAECVRVSTFSRYALRDRLVAAGQHVVARCDGCYQRFALPGAFYCSECITPAELPR